MDNNDFKNIEAIIKYMKEQALLVKKFKKLNGITMECESINSDKRKDAMSEIQNLSKDMRILPVSMDTTPESDVLFGVQYPELIPVYSDEENQKMYNDTFKFLFDNLKMKDPTKVTKTILIENMDRLTRHAINTYCRSNINIYKEKPDDYLNNNKYRLKINGWYLEYVDFYLNLYR